MIDVREYRCIECGHSGNLVVLDCRTIARCTCGEEYTYDEFLDLASNEKMKNHETN